MHLKPINTDMTYTISEIVGMLGLDSSAVVNPDAKVSHLLTDSRSRWAHPDEIMFFALSTPSADGHRYIPELYSAGVRNFVVERTKLSSVPVMPDANVLAVDSPLDILQRLARAHRDRMEATVMAVTGSAGKTTVKEWIATLIGPDVELIRSPRSFNSQTGVPLSIWQMAPAHRLGIFEAGVSMPGEMARLREVIRPDICVFTNIGDAHAEGFADIEEKCAEKAILMRGCKTVVYCQDDELIAKHIPEGAERAAWSRLNPDAILYICAKRTDSNGRDTIIDTIYKGNPHSFTIPFSDRDSIENAITAITAALALGATPDAIKGHLSLLEPIDTRLEVIEGMNSCLIVRDHLASDLSSLAGALDFMRRRAMPGHPLTAILSDVEIQGHEDLADVYRGVSTMLHRAGVTRVIGIGPEFSSHASAFDMPVSTFGSTDEFLESPHSSDLSAETILVKGSQKHEFDKICELLEARQHETVLDINLDAVVHNFNAFRSLIRPTTGIACMIKASGYGAGSHELARTLQAQGATYLAVAVHDEGAELRRAGISMPILVLNPSVADFHALFSNRLEPEIYSLSFLRALISEARRRGIREYPVHIKIDSGMHRLGFRLETLGEVIDLLKESPEVTPRSIFSHLCAADDPAEDSYTRSQFDYFSRCCDMLLSAFPERKILRHILNSTGITRFPEHQLDMVRLGIGLYGIRTLHDGSQDFLRPVSALHTVIISLKRWPEGTTIGYNRRGLLARPSVIATVPIGYADGINRHLGYGNARFNVRGILCPTVGSICMDACMIDVTDVPGVAEGDRVEVFGETIPVETLSDTLGTIPYEVLTSISSRVKRVYYRE